MKRTEHVAPPLFFKFWKGLLYSNRLLLNSARELASPDALKKTPATRNAAQKELTLPEEFLDLAKRPCTGKKFTIRKNAAPEATPTRLMLGRTMNSKTCYTRDHTKKPNERSNV